MSTRIVKVKEKFTGEEVFQMKYQIENFLNNCGYYIFSVSSFNFKKNIKADKVLFLVRETHKEVYNKLIRACNFHKGYRKLVMSGSFSTSIRGYYSAPYYHNQTALFMLANDIPLAGQPTPGKYQDRYVLQMGEIDLKEKMEDKKVDKKFSALFNVTVEEAQRGW